MADNNKENNLQNRIEYYRNKVEKSFSKFPTEFRDFMKDETVIEQGDELIKNRLSTGYNFASGDELIKNRLSTGYNFASLEDFPFLGENPTVFYSNYIQRTTHFAELLAIMENEGIITEDDISFGARATKVDGKWDDKEPKEGSLFGSDGNKITTTEFVEGIIIFSPNTSDQENTIRRIKDIAKFIEKRAVKGAVSEIKDSWYVPDDRIKPPGLLVFLKELNFKQAVVNYLRLERGLLITLKQITKFNKKGWRNGSILLNEQLYSYLSDSPEGEVLP